jgi:hypothetical protein
MLLKIGRSQLKTLLGGQVLPELGDGSVGVNDNAIQIK